MHNYYQDAAAAVPKQSQGGRPGTYSYINFAYVMVYYHGFMRLFEEKPFTREAMKLAQRGKRENRDLS